VLTKRKDGSVNFERDWLAYQNGFGNKSGEYWLGLATMHRVSNKGRSYQLRVDMMLFSGETYYAKYSSFSVGAERGKYALHVSGYTGNAGDSFSYHDNTQFSTFDVDNDVINNFSCAGMFHCGFWFKACSVARLTGLYGETVENTYIGEDEYNQGIFWTYNLDDIHPKYIDMKIRP
ncbi:hypothetical protein LSH36_242g06013, partial [Paralvinella palmiformis]